MSSRVDGPAARRRVSVAGPHCEGTLQARDASPNARMLCVGGPTRGCPRLGTPPRQSRAAGTPPSRVVLRCDGHLHTAPRCRTVTATACGGGIHRSAVRHLVHRGPSTRTVCAENCVEPAVHGARKTRRRRATSASVKGPNTIRPRKQRLGRRRFSGRRAAEHVFFRRAEPSFSAQMVRVDHRVQERAALTRLLWVVGSAARTRRHGGSAQRQCNCRLGFSKEARQRRPTRMS